MRRALVIVADENIPHAGEAFGTLGAVRRMPGRAMTPADARAADVLLVRSVTPVGAGLLAGSRVRFVGSATIGTDHVDTGYLRREGIAFAHAPGANAGSVVEYVLAALLHLSAGRGEALRGKTVGVVGCGNIGGRLAGRVPALGAHVLQNDPPCAEAGAAAHVFAPLVQVLGAAGAETHPPPLALVPAGGRPRGDAQPVLVAHTTAAGARRHLEDPTGAVAPVLAALPAVVGGGGAAGPEESAAHRWRFARPAEPREEAFHLGPARVGLCGDGWGPRPRVEQAWLSGHRLGTELATRLA